MPQFNAETNPRFVWNIGAVRESFPDMPEQAGVILWDRQERKPVVTIHSEYQQAFCLETTRSEGSQPFTMLEHWLNNMAAGDLASEGIPDTQ